MAEYNVETLRKFGERLEQQMSNFQVASDHIDYDFRDICDILRHYESDVNVSDNADAYGQNWYSRRNTIKNFVLKVSAAMLDFYEFRINADQAAQRGIMRSMDMINPETGKTMSATQEVDYLSGKFEDYYKNKQYSSGETQRNTQQLYWKVSKAGWSSNGTWTGPNYDSINTDTWGGWQPDMNMANSPRP